MSNIFFDCWSYCLSCCFNFFCRRRAITNENESLKKNDEINKLGDRYPFGDDELHKLVNVYESLINYDDEDSFLLRLSLKCCSLPEEESLELKMETIVKKFVLRNCGRKLEKMLLYIGLDSFLDVLAQCLRRGSRNASIVFFELCSDDKETVDAFDIVSLGYRLSLATAYLLQEDEKLLLPQSSEANLNYFTDSLLTHENDNFETLQGRRVCLERFLSWTYKFPLFSSSFSTFLHHILFPEKPFPASYSPLYLPNLNCQSSAFFSAPTSPYLFTFACISPSFSGQWHRLYSTDHDGVSFNRLLNALHGYGGPTFILIRPSTDGLFGAFSSSVWKESKDFYGDSGCFLYRMQPNVDIFRARGKKRNFVYCNPEARSKGYDGLAHGIGFGGTSNQPRLFISESFENCQASSSDLTYQEGDLFFSLNASIFTNTKFFDVVSLEVWGVGGDEVVQKALAQRKEQREIIDANIKKARQVDKAQFLDDLNSGLYESKAFKYKAEVQGNHTRG